MTKAGSTFRRCACRNPETGKQYGQSCPKFKQKRHGVWNLRQELPPKKDDDGNEVRRTFRRGGYESATKAQEDLDKVRALLNLPDEDDPEGHQRIAELLEKVAAEKLPLPDLEETKRKLQGGVDLRSDMTVGEWLDVFLDSKRRSARRTTVHGYESHIRVHLKPRIGSGRLDRLNGGHVQGMFDAIEDDNETIILENSARRAQEARCLWTKPGRPPWRERQRLNEERAKLAEMKPYRRTTKAATRQRIRATLRASLEMAIERRLITFNPARKLDLDPGKRPKAQLWTEDRVQRWREKGEIPSAVMVWTPEQFGTFLDAAEGERLYALFHLVGFRGLRRGEAIGQDWTNLDLDGMELTVVKEIVQDGWEVYESDPKTDGSAATIGLDSGTVAVLRAHRTRQLEERLKWGEAWQDTGKVFTREDGSWLHPESVSDTFQRIRVEADLPPINFRDLRHLAATLIHAGGGDIHTIKEVLRHASVALTSDTYTTLLPQVDREVSEKAAKLVPRAQPKAVGETPGLTPGSPGPEGGNVLPLHRADGETFPQVNGGESR